jgi:hypothetical protein
LIALTCLRRCYQRSVFTTPQKILLDSLPPCRRIRAASLQPSQALGQQIRLGSPLLSQVRCPRIRPHALQTNPLVSLAVNQHRNLQILQHSRLLSPLRSRRIPVDNHRQNRRQTRRIRAASLQPSQALRQQIRLGSPLLSQVRRPRIRLCSHHRIRVLVPAASRLRSPRIHLLILLCSRRRCLQIPRHVQQMGPLVSPAISHHHDLRILLRSRLLNHQRSQQVRQRIHLGSPALSLQTLVASQVVNQLYNLLLQRRSHLYNRRQNHLVPAVNHQCNQLQDLLRNLLRSRRIQRRSLAGFQHRCPQPLQVNRRVSQLRNPAHNLLQNQPAQPVSQLHSQVRFPRIQLVSPVRNHLRGRLARPGSPRTSQAPYQHLRLVSHLGSQPRNPRALRRCRVASRAHSLVEFQHTTLPAALRTPLQVSLRRFLQRSQALYLQNHLHYRVRCHLRSRRYAQAFIRLVGLLVRPQAVR